MRLLSRLEDWCAAQLSLAHHSVSNVQIRRRGRPVYRSDAGLPRFYFSYSQVIRLLAAEQAQQASP
jgi:hypothetical protein